MEIEDKKPWEVSPKRKSKMEKCRKKKAKKEASSSEFTVIDSVPIKKLAKVDRVLPEWIAFPTKFSGHLKNITDIKSVSLLDKRMHKALKKNGINNFFPVQGTIIPEILSTHQGAELKYRPRDLCIAAPTGSGKTLAYVIPILQVISKIPCTSLRTIVLLPVTEIANQVYKIFKQYGSLYNVKVGGAFGFTPFEEEQSNIVHCVDDCWKSKIDILVGTPHRVLSHVISSHLSLSSMSFLVLDEADHLMKGETADVVNRIQRYIFQSQKKVFNELNSIFLKEDPLPQTQTIPIKSVAKTSREFLLQNSDKFGHLKVGVNDSEKMDTKDSRLSNIFKCLSFPPPLPSFPRRYIHRLLFSATLSHDPYFLQNLSLYHPKLFTAETEESSLDITSAVNRVARPTELKEEYIIISKNVKLLLLHHLLLYQKKEKKSLRVLVFGNSADVIQKIALVLTLLAHGEYTVKKFSSKDTTNTRKQIVRKFAAGHIHVLVSTDAMARGVDIPHVTTVISYDIPSANTYIHRIGRTARAGKEGLAISLVAKGTLHFLKEAAGEDFNKLKENIVSGGELKQYENDFEAALKKLSSPSFNRKNVLNGKLKKKTGKGIKRGRKVIVAKKKLKNKKT